MPFTTIGGDEHPDWWPPDRSSNPEIVLRQVSRTSFQLLEGFVYSVPDGPRYVVPAHDPRAEWRDANNSTDLATVPRLLSGFFGTYGAHTRAALFHDQFVDVLGTDARPPARRRRDEIDRAFELALAESEVRWLRRKLVWTAVSLRTSWGRWGFSAIVVHLVALAAVVVYGVFGGSLLPALVLTAAGFLWALVRPPLGGAAPGLGWSRATAVAWGAARWPLAVLGFALVAVPLATGFLAQGVVRLADAIEELVAVAGRAVGRADPRRSLSYPTKKRADPPPF